jgi:hypothetical protein
MEIDVRACSSVEELRDALNAISHYFGHENQLEDAERCPAARPSRRLGSLSSVCCRRTDGVAC